MGIQVTRSGTNWTVDVTALGLVNDTAEKDFLVVVAGVEQALAAYAKTTATVITYSGVALPANTVISFYRWGLRDIDTLQYGEVTSQLGMNRRLDQIERVLDDLREVKQFIWNVGIPGDVAVASHVALADPHVQYRLKSATVPVSELSGTLSDAQIPALIARDTEVAAAVSTHEALANPHPGYTTAAQLTAALTGYLPTSQKGAVNGIAPLDGSSKIPAINSRGCSAVYTASTGVWLFTWADGSTQSIDTPLELVFQSVNYNTTTKQVTFTLVGGATTSFSLADLVDLPEVQVATVAPSATPTTGQRLYVRSDTGDYWVSNGSTWVGPFLNLTSAERSQLAGLTTSLAGKQDSDPTLQSIANATASGVIQRNANESVTLLPTGAMAAPLLAAGDAAAVRGLAGIEYLGTQTEVPETLFGITDWAVPAAASADVICDRLFGSVPIVTTAGTTQHFNPSQLFFNEENYTAFSSDVVFEVPVNGDATYSDGYFLIHGYASPGIVPRPTSVQIELYRPDTNTWGLIVPETSWPADNRNLFVLPSDGSLNFTTKVRITVKGSNFWLTKLRWIVTRSNTNPAVYKTETRLQSVLGGFGAKSLIVNGGATQTASLRGTKTVNTPSLTDTITVTGAEVGDIASVSRGKDAFVSAANTIQFDSTGLGGVTVSAIAERFV